MALEDWVADANSDECYSSQDYDFDTHDYATIVDEDCLRVTWE